MSTLKRRTLIALLAAGLAATALPQAAASPTREPLAAAPYRLELPEPTGPYSIGTSELRLVDNSRADAWVPGRRRELMISVWYPALPGARGPRAPYAPPRVAVPLADELGAAFGIPAGGIDYAGTPTHARVDVPALGRHPVVLYSPGFGTSRLVGTNHVEELASRGYVVVTMDHTGEAPVEFPGGRVTPAVVPITEIRKALAVRVADTKFVLDSLDRLPKRLTRAMDQRRLGMFGYSLGGWAAGETMVTDRRIDVGANLDGTMRYNHPAPELSEVAKRGLDRPFLLFGGQGHSHRPQPGSPLDDPSWTSFWANQRGWKLDLNIPDGTHGAFADYQFSAPAAAKAHGIPPEAVTALLGTVDPTASVDAQRAYLGAFFDQFLKGRPQPLLRRESPRYPAVEFVR